MAVQGFGSPTQLETKPVSIVTTDPTLSTLYTPAPGKKFVVYFVYLQNTSAVATAVVYFRSDAATIGIGYLDVAANTSWQHSETWMSEGPPVFMGLAVGEAFKINKTGTGIVEGFVVCDSVVD